MAEWGPKGEAHQQQMQNWSQGACSAAALGRITSQQGLSASKTSNPSMWGMELLWNAPASPCLRKSKLGHPAVPIASMMPPFCSERILYPSPEITCNPGTRYAGISLDNLADWAWLWFIYFLRGKYLAQLETNSLPLPILSLIAKPQLVRLLSYLWKQLNQFLVYRMSAFVYSRQKKPAFHCPDKSQQH